jgi:putative MFS transporter
MAETTSDELLSRFDSAPLNARYWTSFIVMSGVLVLDFFDFFLIAFVMSVIGPEWKLTYGQERSSFMAPGSARLSVRLSGVLSATCSAARCRPSPAP